MIISRLLNPTATQVTDNKLKQVPIDLKYFWSLMAEAFADAPLVVDSVVNTLWPLVNKSLKPLSSGEDVEDEIREELKIVLNSLKNEVLISHYEGKKIFDDLSWAMLSYLDYHCKNTEIQSSIRYIAGKYFSLNQNDMDARLFLLGKDYSMEEVGAEGFLLPLCESSDPWVTLSLLASPHIKATDLTGMMLDNIEVHIYAALEHINTFKEYAFLAEDNCATLLINMAALGVTNKIVTKAPEASIKAFLQFAGNLTLSQDRHFSTLAANAVALVGYQSLLVFMGASFKSQESAAYVFEETVIRFIRHRGVLAAMLRLDTVEGAANQLAVLFDVYAPHLGLRFYRTLFSLFRIDVSRGEYADSSSEQLLSWMFSLKCMREFCFLTNSSVSHRDLFEIIIGLNNSEFNNMLFENNRSLDAEDGMNYTFSSQLKPVGSNGEDDELCGVHPLYAALAAFNPGEDANKALCLGYKKLIFKMLSDEQFKINHYFSVKGTSEFFNNLPQVKLTDQLHRLLCTRHELLTDADYECSGEVDTDLVEVLIRQRFVTDIIALVESPEKSIEARRLAAIMAIVDQLPVEKKVALSNEAPHFILLSLTHNVRECIAALAAKKERASSLVGSVWSRVKNTTDANKIARVHLLTYIKSHLPNALIQSVEDKPSFMYLAYYAVERMAGAEINAVAIAKAALEGSTWAPQMQMLIDAGYAEAPLKMDAAVNEWLTKTILVKTASTLQFIAKPLALLPDDYLDGILQRTGFTKQAIREMAFPEFNPEVFESQQQLLTAIHVRDSLLAEAAADNLEVNEDAVTAAEAVPGASALVARSLQGGGVVGGSAELPPKQPALPSSTSSAVVLL